MLRLGNGNQNLISGGSRSASLCYCFVIVLGLLLLGYQLALGNRVYLAKRAYLAGLFKRQEQVCVFGD